MFTKIRQGKAASNSRPAKGRRARGRPRGTTERGIAARRHLHEIAIKLIATRGYEATTLRDIAKKAKVSVGLLYRYFPSKRAVVLALYDELSSEYADRASRMDPGPWHGRFLFALTTSLGVLAQQRDVLAALAPVLVGDAQEGLFASTTGFSRRRVQAVFHEAVRGASDAPEPDDAAALGRLLYVVHLTVILWWLLDKSPHQRATGALIATLQSLLPLAAPTLRLEPARAFVQTADLLCRQGLFGEGKRRTAKEAEEP